MLVDERDPGTAPRMMFYLEHAIKDSITTPSGEQRIISQRVLNIEMDRYGHTSHIHYAPYLDYRPLKEGEPGDRCHPEPAGMQLDFSRDGACGAKLCHHPCCPGAPAGSTRNPPEVDPEDRSSRQRPADQGNCLLGFPGGNTETAGKSGKGQCPPELGEARKRLPTTWQAACKNVCRSSSWKPRLSRCPQ